MLLMRCTLAPFLRSLSSSQSRSKLSFWSFSAQTLCYDFLLSLLIILGLMLMHFRLISWIFEFIFSI